MQSRVRSRSAAFRSAGRQLRAGLEDVELVVAGVVRKVFRQQEIHARADLRRLGVELDVGEAGVLRAAHMIVTADLARVGIDLQPSARIVFDRLLAVV